MKWLLETFPSKAASRVRRIIARFGGLIGFATKNLVIRAVAIPLDLFPSRGQMKFIGARHCWYKQTTRLDCNCVECNWRCDISWPEEKPECTPWSRELVPDYGENPIGDVDLWQVVEDVLPRTCRPAHTKTVDPPQQDNCE